MPNTIWKFENKSRQITLESNELAFLLYELNTFYGIKDVPMSDLIFKKHCSFVVITDTGKTEEVTITEITPN